MEAPGVTEHRRTVGFGDAPVGGRGPGEPERLIDRVLRSQTSHQGVRAFSQLLRIATVATSTRRRASVLREIAGETAEVCRADRCTIYVWREHALIPIASRYSRTLTVRAGRRPPKSLAVARLDDIVPLARARREHTPVVIVDPARDPTLSPAWRASLGDGPFVVLALVQRSRFVGMLVLDNSVTRRAPGSIQLDVARVVAGQLALILDHARLVREMRHVVQEAETLLNVGTAVASALDLAELVRRIVREAARAIGADSAGIYGTRDGGRTMDPLAAYHIPTEVLDGLRHEPLLSREFQDLIGRVRWSDDVPNDPAFQHPVFKRFPVQSLLLVPLELRNSQIGLLVCAWWTTPRRIEPDELRLMEAIAGQAAVAIEATRLACLAERAAVGRERTRMDGLLHDTLASTLFALALKLDTCLHGSECSEDLRAKLETVKEHAKTMMAQIRGLVAPPGVA